MPFGVRPSVCLDQCARASWGLPCNVRASPGSPAAPARPRERGRLVPRGLRVDADQPRLDYLPSSTQPLRTTRGPWSAATGRARSGSGRCRRESGGWSRNRVLERAALIATSQVNSGRASAASGRARRDSALPTGTGRDSPRDQESVGPPLARAGLVGAASRLVHAGQIWLEASRSAETWSRPQVEHETRSVALRRPATWRARASGSRLRPAESRRFGPFGPSGSLRRALRFRGCSAVLPTLESFADADRRPFLFVFF